MRRLARLMLVALLASLPVAVAEAAPTFPVEIEAHDVLPGAIETVVELHNTRDVAISGRVELASASSRSFSRAQDEVTAEAPFALGPNARGRLVLVATALNRYSLNARVVLSDGTRGDNEPFGGGRYSGPGANTFVDLSGHAMLLGLLTDAQVPLTAGSISSGHETVTAVGPSATPSGVTPLPTTLGGYSSASLVHIGTRHFLELGQNELIALVDFTAHGGTLAFSVDDPDQLADRKLVALLGGVVHSQPASATAFGDAPAVSRQAADRTYDLAPDDVSRRAVPPADAVLARFVGGNTTESAYGSTAAYGLGRVVLLPFHAIRAAADPWTIGKLAELTVDSAGHRKRRFSEIADAGNGDTSLQRALDPNQRFRITLGVATAALLAYAAFVAWRLLRDQKQRRLLRAFVWLPALAALVSVGIFTVGFVSRGAQRGIRRVMLIEGGAGMGLVSVDEYRGYFTSGSDLLTLVSQTPRSLLYATALGPVHQRDGFSFLRDKPLLPWQTTVTRELRMEQSEQEIALGELDDRPWISNRTAAGLEDVFLTASSGSVYFLPHVGSGEHVVAGTAQLAHAGAMPTGYPFDVEGFTDLEASVRERVEVEYRIFAALVQQRDLHPEGTVSMFSRTSQNEAPFARSEAPREPLPLQTVATFVHVVGTGGAP